MKKKLKLIKTHEERLKAQSESKDEYITKLEIELAKIKDNYRIAVAATGYSEEKDKEKTAKKLKAFSVSRIRSHPLSKGKNSGRNNAASSWKIQAEAPEDLVVYSFS